MTIGVRSERNAASRNERGSAEARRRRREWLVVTYRADRDLHELIERIVLDGDGAFLTRYEIMDGVPLGQGVPACRCYRCGRLLTSLTLTVDRIIPGVDGGTYRRDNIRPACFGCNNETGQTVGKKAR